MNHLADHMNHHHMPASAEAEDKRVALGHMAFKATLHCLGGCAIGEVGGMVIGTWLGLGMWQTVALAVTLAFITGFGLTMIPLLQSGMGFRPALAIAFAADFISVAVMEIVDNAVIMAVPGAMAAGLTDPCSGGRWPWGSVWPSRSPFL